MCAGIGGAGTRFLPGRELNRMHSNNDGAIENSHLRRKDCQYSEGPLPG